VYVLVVLGTMFEFSVVHCVELYILNRVVGVKRVRGTIDTVVVGTTLDFLFVLSRSVLILAVSEDMRSCYGWRSGSSVGSCVPSSIDLSVGCGTTLFSLPPSSVMG
jgi:hypothetical protein